MANQMKPWIKENGERLSEAELKGISKTWNATQWEEYLRENVEVAQNDFLPASGSVENYDSEFQEIYQSLLDTGEHHPHLEECVRFLLKRLTLREREVIYKIFWEGLSQHQVAGHLRISRDTVRRYRDKALRKLGIMFVERLLPKSIRYSQPDEITSIAV